MNHADLIKEALKLDARERASMAGRLLESLDDLSTDEAEHLWLDEAQRRDAAVQDGRLSSVPAQQVIAELKAVLGCVLRRRSTVSPKPSCAKPCTTTKRRRLGWDDGFCRAWSPPWRKSWNIHLSGRHCVVMCGAKA